MQKSCENLFWKAEPGKKLERNLVTSAFWDFVSFNNSAELSENKPFRIKLAELWNYLIQWASLCLSGKYAHDDCFALVHHLMKDSILSERFSVLFQNDRFFRTRVVQLLEFSPVFDALWIRQNSFDEVCTTIQHQQFVKKAAKNHPFIHQKGVVIPLFSPGCALEHLENGEKIPEDWPHVLSVIQQLQKNMFLIDDSDEACNGSRLLESAYHVLYEVWKAELPVWMLSDRLSWEQVLIRSGFLFEKRADKLIFPEENSANLKYLEKILKVTETGSIDGAKLVLAAEFVDEKRWISALEICHKGAEGGGDSDLELIDIYIAGVVRQLSRLGFTIHFSCDGHARKDAIIRADSDLEARVLCVMLNLFHHGWHVRNTCVFMRFRKKSRKILFELAEWIYTNAEILKRTKNDLEKITPAPCHEDIPQRSRILRKGFSCSK